jgi:hypothetical protein
MSRVFAQDEGGAGVELQLFRGDDFANGRLYPAPRGRARGVLARRQPMAEKGRLTHER